MPATKNHASKIIGMTAVSLAASLLTVSPVHAQTAAEQQNDRVLQKIFAKMTQQQLLANIAFFTYKTWGTTLNLMNNWIMADDTDSSANLQAAFTNATNATVQDAVKQKSFQQTLTKDFLASLETPPDKFTLPYINDYTYQTMLKQPYQIPDPRTLAQGDQKPENPDLPYNYIKNAAGLNILHPKPGSSWSGEDSAKEKYKNFYTTVSSIQSYNGYVLSELYAETQNTSPQRKSLLDQQNALMQQASNSTWFKQIATENIGIVLRQILMYNSQVYVLLTQLLQTQKEMLSAQIMTNTLLVLGNQFTETQLVTNAKGGMAP